MKGLSTRLFSTAWRQHHRQLCQIPLDCRGIAVRLCSTKPAIVQCIEKKVNPFGKLVIDVPYHVEIKPTDPHQYPDMDTLLVKLFSIGDKPQEKAELVSVNVGGVCDIRVKENQQLSEIKCLIEAPISYDVDVKTTGEGQVSISDMVSDTINVQTEFGSITGTKLQGQKISLSSSEGGSVVLRKSVQGSIEINTANEGTVDAEKCLGTNLDISTENGDIYLGSNYCEKSTFTTLNGNLELNNLHKDSTIDINGSGSLNITCLDGSLQANLQEGSAKIQLVRITDDSKILSNGEVVLTVPEDCDVKLVLQAQKLDIDPNISGNFSETRNQFISKNNGNTFQVETGKNLHVTRSSWMESLKLGKYSK